MVFKFISRMLGLILCTLLCGGMWSQEAPVLHAADPITKLPANFVMQSVVTGLHIPTDMVFLPSGDIFVTEKGVGKDVDGVANVRLVHQGQLMVDPVMSISVNVFGDSGLYSILLDPNFATNHYFYLWYSVGKNGLGWTGESTDRLSRFTYDPLIGKADVLTEKIIIDGLRWSQWHNGGGLAFDAGGNLLIATGDAASNGLSQDRTLLNGKLLRIRPNADGGYTVPADNPFVGEVDVRPEIYAYGLRNPFRMAWRPADQAFYLLDVGLGAWEEVNRVEAGANYGWSVREGPCPRQVKDPDCPPAPPIYTEPVVSYVHPPEGGAGITAMAFYTGTSWPAEYQGRLYFADFNSHRMFMVDLEEPETILPFGEEIGNLVDIEATADGLYTLSIYDGVIRFIYYAADGNHRPAAQLNSTPKQGAAPLTVDFSAAASVDPDNDALTYHWDFGDDSAPTSGNESSIRHSYTSDGDYQATLRVVDAKGGESELVTANIQVYSGAMPTVTQEIMGSAGRERYRGGDQVIFRAERVDGTAGLDPNRPYQWSVKQHHNQHVHFVITEFVGNEVVLNISDDSHAADVSLWYEAELTMHTVEGQAVRVMHALQPNVVLVNVQSSPTGAAMHWNDLLQPPNQSLAAVVGQRFMLEAPEILYYGRTKNQFSHWTISNDGAGEDEMIDERRFEVLVSAEAKRYIAHYEFLAESYVNHLPAVTKVVAGRTQ